MIQKSLNLLTKRSFINQGIMTPNNIVVIGGSNNTTNPGGQIVKNLVESFDGNAFIVNPKADNEIQGYPAFTSIMDLPDDIPYDLSIISVNSKHVVPSVEQLIEKGIKSFICISAGFGEVGNEDLEMEFLNMIEENECSLIGPNCIGVMNENYNGTFIGMGTDFISREGVDFVSQSGASAIYLFEQAMRTGLKFRSVYSIGNSPQNGVEEVLELWDEGGDSGSKVKLIYMEELKNPKKFYKHARSLIEKGCTISCIKSGTSESGKRAASSHTGAMASTNLFIDQFFDEVGLLSFDSREEFINTAKVLEYLYHCNGNEMIEPSTERPYRMGIITQAGGPGVMLVDMLEGIEERFQMIEVPYLGDALKESLLPKLHYGSSVANPIDFLAQGAEIELDSCFKALGKEADLVDAIAVIYGDPGFFDIKPVMKYLAKEIRGNNSSRPIFPILPSLSSSKHTIDYFLNESGFSFFDDEVAFGKALKRVLKRKRKSKLIRREEGRKITEEVRNSLDLDALREVCENLKRGEFIDPLSFAEILRLLEIPQVDYRVCTEAEECLEFFEGINARVAMKVVGPVHKSDSGGVILNVGSAEEVKENYERLMNIEGSEGVLMQKMVKDEGYREMFIGAIDDWQFGHAVLYGLGGTEVEVFENLVGVVLVKYDLNPTRFRFDIQKRNWGKFFEEEFRGKPGMDQEQFCDILLRIGIFCDEFEDVIAEIDLNPLLYLRDEGFIVVDGRIKTKD